jgi:hypothetical protein
MIDARDYSERSLDRRDAVRFVDFEDIVRMIDFNPLWGISRLID